MDRSPFPLYKRKTAYAYALSAFAQWKRLSGALSRDPLSPTCGLRLGEILAIQRDSIGDHSLEVYINA
jgi:hypothetical protein